MTDDHTTESCEQPAVAARLDELEQRLVDTEAAVQALRGYVGGRRAEVATVGQRADAALAAVDRLARAQRGDDNRRENSDNEPAARPDATSDGER